MFDPGYTELLLVAIIALLVIGPKDLPKVMRQIGRMLGQVRATARHFKAGMDEMIRQAELEEMREKWDAHNEAIMKGAPGDPDLAPAPTKPDAKPVPSPTTSATEIKAADAPSPSDAPSEAGSKPEGSGQ